MSKRVLISARDLVFRAKLGAVVAAAGGDVVREDTACDLAILDVESPDALTRIRAFVLRGVAVVAYGPHVDAQALRGAREAGAAAVPNSQVEARLRELLRNP